MIAGSSNGMVCVWPLVEGLQGVDGAGHACTLVAGRRGWMPEAAALRARAQDEVQFMAGMSTSELRAPRTAQMEPEKDSTLSLRGRKKRYRRADIQAENP